MEAFCSKDKFLMNQSRLRDFYINGAPSHKSIYKNINKAVPRWFRSISVFVCARKGPWC